MARAWDHQVNVNKAFYEKSNSYNLNKYVDLKLVSALNSILIDRVWWIPNLTLDWDKKGAKPDKKWRIFYINLKCFAKKINTVVVI